MADAQVAAQCQDGALDQTVAKQPVHHRFAGVEGCLDRVAGRTNGTRGDDSAVGVVGVAGLAPSFETGPSMEPRASVRPGLKAGSEKSAMIFVLDSTWLAQVSLAIIACA